MVNGRWFVLFAVLAVVWTWPLGAHLSSRVPHDPGDPILNTWILWWNAQRIPFTPGWWDPPFLFPLRGTLALSEHLAGISIITTPIQRAGGGAILAYNVALIASFALSAFFAFLLVYRLSGSTPAAIFAGLAYGFAPYRTGQLAHIQVLTSQWLPLALLGLHWFLDTGRVRALVLFAGAWGIQALSNGYYLLFFPVLLALWVAWFGGRSGKRARAVAIVAAWAIASLPLVPILWKYHTVQTRLGLFRTAADMEQFSAIPSSLLRASPLLAFWPSLPGRTEEDYLFPGVTVVVLLAAAIALSRGRLRDAIAGRSDLLFYATATAVMYALSFGPARAGSGIAMLAHPYTLLTFLPGFGGLRAPARFAMFGALCLSVAGGLALAVILRGARRRRPLVALACFAGLFVDCWARPMPLAGPPGRLVLSDNDNPAAAVLELPVDDASVSVAAMYRAMFHRRPLVNGYTGYTPPHYAILNLGLRRGDPSMALELARGRALFIVVSDRSDPGHEWRQYVEALPGVEQRGAGSGGLLYLLPAQPTIRTPPAGARLHATVTETAPEWIEVDLASERTVRTLEFPVRWHYGELGRRMAIEASADRANWTTAWEDWTGGPTLAASFIDPLLVPVRIAVPDVRTRYLRIHPAPPWLARELIVRSP